MSHFTVLVIGDDVEGQLAPYDEDLEVEPYREYWSDDDVARFEEHYGLKVSAALDVVLEKMRDWNGRENGYDGERDEFYSLSTYNPKSKWDWYQVGGRWRGFFQMKEGALAEVGRPGVPEMVALQHGEDERDLRNRADLVRKGDVDFAAMRAIAAAEAEVWYSNYEQAIVGTPEPESWAEVRERHGDDDNAARDEYNAQPRVRALHAAKIMPWFEAVEEVYGGGREAYVQRAVDRVAVPYALVKDGEWFGKGEMGWFGISHDDVAQDEWNRKVQELYDSLPDDTPLTLVDCHI